MPPILAAAAVICQSSNDYLTIVDLERDCSNNHLNKERADA